ncbi:hypothetical protein PCE1_004675 [Barthelona sp. PCE]
MPAPRKPAPFQSSKLDNWYARDLFLATLVLKVQCDNSGRTHILADDYKVVSQLLFNFRNSLSKELATCLDLSPGYCQIKIETLMKGEFAIPAVYKDRLPSGWEPPYSLDQGMEIMRIVELVNGEANLKDFQDALDEKLNQLQ